MMLGLEVTTSLSGEVSNLRFAPGFCQRRIDYTLTGTAKGNYRDWSSEGLQFSFPTKATVSSISTSAANVIALEAFAKEIYKAQRTLNGGQQTGEMLEAIRMLRNPLKSLRKGFDVLKATAKKRSLKYVSNRAQFEHMRRRNRRKYRSYGKMLTDTYLEWVYGWSPLMSSIDDITEGIERIGKRRHTKYVKAEGRSDLITHPQNLALTSGTLSLRAKRRRIQTGIYVYRGTVKVGQITDTRGFMKLSGFDWTDFIPTAYQLFPYSFVLDYFTNTGDVINAMAIRKSDLAWSNRTRVQEVTQMHVDHTFDQYTPPAGYAVTSESFMRHVCLRVDKKFSRTAYTGSLVPPLRFELPVGGSLKWLNLAALTASKGIFK
jgi:hypothetical protein